MSMLRSLSRPGATFSLILLLALALGACAPSGGGTGTAGAFDCPGTGTATFESGGVAICSDDLRFDATTIEAPAGEEFTITLTNAETQPHNVAIYISEGGEEIVVGEIITGPDRTTQVDVPALEPGTYYFRCDVHPEMEGELVVG
jgi:plastocyanin